MFLIWDTETTGLVKNNAPASSPLQPHLVQLALILAEFDHPSGYHTRACFSLIVKPDGYAIPDGAAAVHGITTEMALRAGVPLVTAGALFSQYAKLTTHQVAHNAPFDVLVMQPAFHRLGRPAPLINPLCTMNISSPITDLPPTERMQRAGFTKNKPPNLGECVSHFFNEGLDGAHDALVDARACARVFFHLMGLGKVPGFSADGNPIGSKEL